LVAYVLRDLRAPGGAFHSAEDADSFASEGGAEKREGAFYVWTASQIDETLGSGDGAELRRPLGIAIVGGLIVSQMLTLYTTPVVYLYLDRFRLWSQRLWRARPGGHALRATAPGGAGR
jgi:hypothetical protein